jgi:hypothetical protein
MWKGWSLYLAELYENLFEEFEVRTTQFETTGSTVVSEVVVLLEKRKKVVHIGIVKNHRG